MPTKLISVPTAARLLGHSPHAVRRLIKNGVLAAVQIPGTHPRVSLIEVESYIPERIRPTVTAVPVPRPKNRKENVTCQ